MGAVRGFAAKLLRAMLRCAPESRRDWAEAMLRELDYVGADAKGGDWAAVFWALGCAIAIFRECLSAWGAWIAKRSAELLRIRSNQEETKMNSTGKKTLGVLAGMGTALALGVGAFLLRNVIADVLLSVGVPRTMWTHILTVIVPVEAIVVVAAILLWRRKRTPIAVGLLVPAVVMGAHVAVFLANR